MCVGVAVVVVVVVVLTVCYTRESVLPRWVVVVVLTVCMTKMSVHERQRSSTELEEQCPCGHGSRPRTCVQSPKKSPASAQAVPNECNCGSTTDFSTTAPVDLARPAQKGQRTPCHELQLGGWTMGICLCITTGMSLNTENCDPCPST